MCVTLRVDVLACVFVCVCLCLHRTTPDSAVLLSEGQSGVHHLLGLIGGYAEKVGDLCTLDLGG